MSQIEVGEIEKLRHYCAWVKRLAGTIQPALTAMVNRVTEIEKQCNIWEFRLRHTEEEENEN